MSTREQVTQQVRDAFDAVCRGRVEAAVKAEREACALANQQQARAAQATARIAITHLQAVLNTARTHAEQQAADTAARDWLISIGSDPT